MIPAEIDAELMQHVKDGDEPSFAVLLAKYRGPVIRFIFRIVQDGPASEELSQEVFLRVFRSRQTYIPTAKFTTWLFSIAVHLALNWLRDGKKERSQERLDMLTTHSLVIQVADRNPNIEQSMLHATRLAEVRHAVSKLPEKQRDAVFMHKYEDMDYAHIAGAFGCSEAAVKSLLFRAYRTLRRRLAYLVL